MSAPPDTVKRMFEVAMAGAALSTRSAARRAVPPSRQPYADAGRVGTGRPRGEMGVVKRIHEFRDPVHQFILVKSDERRVIDSRPVQRLRDIHQLAMSYMVYPGATHRRFEHSLGVMELAGNVFDVLTHHDNVSDAIREVVPELNEPDNFPYWRSVVRMAALCHDIGHLPFSHAAEHDMLSDGATHETLTKDLILSPEMQHVWESITPPIVPSVVAKLAVGPEKFDSAFSVWETLLSEIIVGDAFGVDRIDYLLRDSLHAGVAYGRFDHYRLIGTLRFLPPAPEGTEEDTSGTAPVVGVDGGGIHAAEALLLARYFMFTQVYFHPVRVMYDMHLVEFLRAWLPGGQYTSDLSHHLALTDNDVLIAIRDAAADRGLPGHEPARRIAERDHFKLLYERNSSDLEISLEPSSAILAWISDKWGADKVRMKRSTKRGGSLQFPVRTHDDRVASSFSLSETLKNLPDASYDRVYVAPEIREEASKMLKKDRTHIIRDWSTTEEEA